MFFFSGIRIKSKILFLKIFKKKFFIVEIEAGLGWALMG